MLRINAPAAVGIVSLLVGLARVFSDGAIGPRDYGITVSSLSFEGCYCRLGEESRSSQSDFGGLLPSVGRKRAS